VGIGDLSAEQQARGLPAQGVPDHGDLAAIKAPVELGDGALDRVELVEDARHVLGARAPVQGRFGVVGVQAQRPRAQVGGLDHDKAVRRVEVGERCVAVQ
jgi:hypothetical protein